MKRRRVVITAIGLVTPLGGTTKETFEALLAGQCGLEPDPTGVHDIQVGLVKTDISAAAHPAQIRMTDRVTHLAQYAAEQVLLAADLNETEKTQCGVFVGTGIGGVGTLCRAVQMHHGLLEKRPILVVPAVMPNAPCAQIAQNLRSMAEAQTYATACSAGAVAIGEAFRRIRDGYLDLAIAGGVESMMEETVIAAWKQLHVLCAAPAAGQLGGCRPFSHRRSGFAFSEGAAMLMLESAEHARARGATVIAELCGYGTSNDGTHPLRPNPQGQVLAMSRCLADAELNPHDVGYVNAHATGTLVGDQIETEALKTVFGSRASELPVSSIKGAVGHMIGAAGAVEAAVTALTVQTGQIAPTLFWEAGDEKCDLDYVPHAARTVSGLSVALSNSFGMGGNNAVLAFRNYA